MVKKKMKKAVKKYAKVRKQNRSFRKMKRAPRRVIRLETEGPLMQATLQTVLEQPVPRTPKPAKLTTKIANKDIKLLEEGFVPEKSKIGTEFKGKNKIVVS